MGKMVMDRYRLLIKKEPKPIAYHFRPSNSIIRVAGYLAKCIADRVDFYSNGINSTILESALIRLSRNMEYSIVVESEVLEKVLRMTYGYKRIYSLKTIPNNVYKVICVYPVIKKNLIDKEIILNIR